MSELSMGSFTYWHELGTYRQHVYYLGVRTEPRLDDVQSFAVVLYYERSGGTPVEVAKVDNSSHEEGEIHVDRYYREPSAPRKDFDVSFESYVDAERYVCENWRWFARLYERNHG